MTWRVTLTRAWVGFAWVMVAYQLSGLGMALHGADYRHATSHAAMLGLCAAVVVARCLRLRL